MNNSEQSNEWNISTDIYEIVDSLNKLKQRIIDDEDETTLALGVYGYITDTEAKKIQSSTIMTGQLGNEMFPTRARLTKNVLTHSIYCNIEDINASPSKMVINFGVKVKDFEQYMRNNIFTIDCESPIFIGEYEFHFDYDIILSRTKSKNTDEDSYVYSAHYDMRENNRLSNVKDPYLKQPFVIRIGNDMFVVFQAMVRQYSIEKTYDKIISESIIENKTYTFEFDNQIADFDVYITDNGKTERLTPIPYGASLGNEKKYCWYLFITDNTIRVTFDNKSIIPGLNSDIMIRSYTTLGAGGIFNYKKVDENSNGLYATLSSDKYNYDKINCYVIATTDSEDGTDRKNKEELQKLIPKAALSRGSITTSTDVSNYFNLIDNEQNRLAMSKKVDNQFSRIWYGYFLLKDDDGNIIPTNSVKINIIPNDKYVKITDDGRFILPAGTILRYDKDTLIAEIIDESNIPQIYSDEYFNDDQYYYYMSIYNILINPDPLYSAFYLTISNKYKYFSFEWVNESAILQFITTRCNFRRNLLTEQNMYKLSFKIAQSISEDYGLYYDEYVDEYDAENNKITKIVNTNNMKCIIVFYKKGVAYRWQECNLVDFEEVSYISTWELNLETDNEFDIENDIKINNLKVVGTNYTNYGFFENCTEAKLYILGKFVDGEYGRYDLDPIVPGLDGYTVTNIYNIESGLDLYENFTNVLDSKIDIDKDHNYQITGLPVVGLHYMNSEQHADYLIDAIAEKKAYIDYCLILLENSMYVDFKFFNTYGPSRTYSIGDKEETLIGHIDLSLRFRVSLKNSSDVYIKDALINEVKKYIEDLYTIEDWHAPVMITTIMNKYSSQINFLEFMNYNDFRLGLQHITKIKTTDPSIVPEFINVRNQYNVEGILVPCIDMEIVQ